MVRNLGRAAGTVATLAVLAGLVSPALAQGGATGGTIGKQNKSVSGEAPRAPAATPQQPVPSARAVRPEMQRPVDNCKRVAGTWTANGWWNGVYGRGDVQLNADGTARHKSGIVGHWICQGTSFAMNWTNWVHSTGTLSADGNTVTYPDGATMTRGR